MCLGGVRLQEVPDTLLHEIFMASNFGVANKSSRLLCRRKPNSPFFFHSENDAQVMQCGWSFGILKCVYYCKL